MLQFRMMSPLHVWGSTCPLFGLRQKITIHFLPASVGVGGSVREFVAGTAADEIIQLWGGHIGHSTLSEPNGDRRMLDAVSDAADGVRPDF